MQSVSNGLIWRTAWQRFETHWVAAVLLISGIVVISLIPYLGNVLSFIGQVVLISFALKAWDLPEKPSSYYGIFPQSLFIYLKIMLFNFLAALVVLPFLFGFIAEASLEGFSEELDEEKIYLILAGVAISILIGLAIQVLFFSYPFIIVDTDAKIVYAISRSYQLSKENMRSVLLYFLTAIGVNILGALACGLGLLITAPLTYIAGAGLYRSLSASSGAGSGDSQSLLPRHI